MSCEDDQSECMKLYHQLREAGVLSDEESSQLSEWFVDFGEAYDIDDDDTLYDVLEDIGSILKFYVGRHPELNLKVGWFVESR